MQVAKDPIGTKGARITTHITLPGRYMVFMPTVNHLGISRRIGRDRERRKLRDFVKKHRPKGAGFIVRTVCAGKPTSALKQDMDYLIETWETIKANKVDPRLQAASTESTASCFGWCVMASPPMLTAWSSTTARSTTKSQALSGG